VAYPHDQAPGQQLAASEQRFQQEFGPAPSGLFTIGLGGAQRHRYQAVNDAYCALTGYRRDELSGEDFWRDVHPDELPALRTWSARKSAWRRRRAARPAGGRSAGTWSRSRTPPTGPSG